MFKKLQYKTFKFHFEFAVHSVTDYAPKTTELGVKYRILWKRGSKKGVTEPKRFNKALKQIEIEDHFSFSGTLFQSKKKGIPYFKTKLIAFQLEEELPNGKKSIVAKREFNLAEYSDAEKERTELLTLNMGIKSSRVCAVKVTLHTKSLKAYEAGAEPSEMTGVDSEQLSEKELEQEKADAEEDEDDDDENSEKVSPKKPVSKKDEDKSEKSEKSNKKPQPAVKPSKATEDDNSDEDEDEDEDDDDTKEMRPKPAISIPPAAPSKKSEIEGTPAKPVAASISEIEKKISEQKPSPSSLSVKNESASPKSPSDDRLAAKLNKIQAMDEDDEDDDDMDDDDDDLPPPPKKKEKPKEEPKPTPKIEEKNQKIEEKVQLNETNKVDDQKVEEKPRYEEPKTKSPAITEEKPPQVEEKPKPEPTKEKKDNEETPEEKQARKALKSKQNEMNLELSKQLMSGSKQQSEHLQQVEQQRDEAKKKLKAIQLELERVKIELSRTQESETKKDTEIFSQKVIVEQLKLASNEAQKKIKELEKKYNAATEKKQDKTRELLTDFEKERDTLAKKLEDQKKSLDEKVKSYEAEIGTWKSKNEELQSKINALQENIAELQKDIQDYTKELNTKRIILQTLQNERGNSDSESKKYKDVIAELKKKEENRLLCRKQDTMEKFIIDTQILFPTLEYVDGIPVQLKVLFLTIVKFRGFEKDLNETFSQNLISALKYSVSTPDQTIERQCFYVSISSCLINIFQQDFQFLSGLIASIPPRDEIPTHAAQRKIARSQVYETPRYGYLSNLPRFPEFTPKTRPNVENAPQKDEQILNDEFKETIIEILKCLSHSYDRLFDSVTTELEPRIVDIFFDNEEEFITPDGRIEKNPGTITEELLQPNGDEKMSACLKYLSSSLSRLTASQVEPRIIQHFFWNISQFIDKFLFNELVKNCKKFFNYAIKIKMRLSFVEGWFDENGIQALDNNLFFQETKALLNVFVLIEAQNTLMVEAFPEIKTEVFQHLLKELPRKLIKRETLPEYLLDISPNLNIDDHALTIKIDYSKFYDPKKGKKPQTEDASVFSEKPARLLKSIVRINTPPYFISEGDDTFNYLITDVQGGQQNQMTPM